MDVCTGLMSEQQCLQLTSGDGDYRCYWETTRSTDYDCSQLWPTTTSTPTEPAGCCRGSSYKANGKCAKAMDQGKCEKNGCNWLVTDDPEDCVITTTKSPTTTAEA